MGSTKRDRETWLNLGYKAVGDNESIICLGPGSTGPKERSILRATASGPKLLLYLASFKLKGLFVLLPKPKVKNVSAS